ncbi:hypothetical protein R2F61_07020 [Mollicutes bacterium LVI A0078]|nr:hypothetical protein RZE84_07025 [Mollicutes bacterium LVI A0075]WOO90475.1 hypothetical protein R2F61_07020 [Mollicutes bacterium LVI A0078]
MNKREEAVKDLNDKVESEYPKFKLDKWQDSILCFENIYDYNHVGTFEAITENKSSDLITINYGAPYITNDQVHQTYELEEFVKVMSEHLGALKLTKQDIEKVESNMKIMGIKADTEAGQYKVEVVEPSLAENNKYIQSSAILNKTEYSTLTSFDNDFDRMNYLVNGDYLKQEKEVSKLHYENAKPVKFEDGKVIQNKVTEMEL